MEQKKIDFIKHIQELCEAHLKEVVKEELSDSNARIIGLVALTNIFGLCGGYLRGVEDAKTDNP